MRASRILVTVSAAAAIFATVHSLTGAGDAAADKKAKINDAVELSPAWVYDDLPAALAQAKKENKPVLAVFR